MYTAIMKKNILGLLFVFCVGALSAQESLVGLYSNPAVEHLYATRKDMHTKDDAVLQLPFFDDFSNYSGYPDNALWTDRHAFVNSSYAVFPPTVGVATLDALNDSGHLHYYAGISQFGADTLTSRCIRLDSLFVPYKKAVTAADSIYMSFYFQPGGGYGYMWERIGNAPAVEDSIILEFYDNGNERWNIVWASAGFELDTLYANTGLFFKYVNILIDDSAYFSDRFRFRFRNYCSLDNTAKPGLAGNTDQWNIDYVYINNGRSAGDTTIRDVAFVMPANSFLRNYRAMPYRQYRDSDMLPNSNLTITNLYSNDLECNYSYVVEDKNGNVIETYSGGHDNISPFLPEGTYQTAAAHATPPIDFKFTVGSNSAAEFVIKHIIKNGITGDLHPENDTIVFNQVFDNYYAYDDGTPENGYGITSTSSRISIAYKFTLNATDTLTAIDMFFNKTIDDENSEIPFYITIWDDNNGEPGNEIYKSSQAQYPQFGSLNQYKRYVLERGVRVNGTIYVGFEQRSKNFINLGFDRNNDARQFIYYKTGLEWQQSILLGALMIRPYFGVKATVGIAHNEHNGLGGNTTIYPNPAKNIINIEIENSNINPDALMIYIHDMHGKCIYQTNFANTINVDHLPQGAYIIHIADEKNNNWYTTKIIISK